MSLYQKFIQNERLRRFCVLALIIFVLYLSRSMITTILLTFIFTYLAVRLVHFVQRYMKIPTIVIVLLTYALVVFLIYLAITKYVPVLVNQTTQMINSVVDFYQSPHTDTNQVLQFIDQYLEKSNLLSTPEWCFNDFTLHSRYWRCRLIICHVLYFKFLLYD